eukprot:TRINITY_DN718_c0_g1_i1.p1 TRINITY_DN718_c0_g1~~TRINITY_DN718_c0_g1_i1.p1  ORF type:complete len:1423 (+),score=319.67 TRINITY_DN718_c0_g1_i1:1896-6164(+)
MQGIPGERRMSVAAVLAGLEANARQQKAAIKEHVEEPVGLTDDLLSFAAYASPRQSVVSIPSSKRNAIKGVKFAQVDDYSDGVPLGDVSSRRSIPTSALNSGQISAPNSGAETTSLRSARQSREGLMPVSYVASGQTNPEYLRRQSRAAVLILAAQQELNRRPSELGGVAWHPHARRVKAAAEGKRLSFASDVMAGVPLRSTEQAPQRVDLSGGKHLPARPMMIETTNSAQVPITPLGPAGLISAPISPRHPRAPRIPIAAPLLVPGTKLYSVDEQSGESASPRQTRPTRTGPGTARGSAHPSATQSAQRTPSPTDLRIGTGDEHNSGKQQSPRRTVRHAKPAADEIPGIAHAQQQDKLKAMIRRLSVGGSLKVTSTSAPDRIIGADERRGSVFGQDPVSTRRPSFATLVNVTASPSMSNFLAKFGQTVESNPSAVVPEETEYQVFPFAEQQTILHSIVEAERDEDYPNIISHLSEALDKGTSFVAGLQRETLLLRRGGWFAQLGMRKEALADFTAVIDSGSKQKDVVALGYVCRSLLMSGTKQLERAMGDMHQAVQLCKTDVTLMHRARMFQQLSNEERALKDCEEALSLNPHNTEALLMLARSSKQANMLEKALMHLRVLLRFNPIHTDSLLDRAEIYAETLRFDLALSDVRKAIEIKPSYRAYRIRALLLRKRDPASAIRSASIALCFDDAETRVMLLFRAALYCQLQQWEPALYDYKQVAMHGPLTAGAHHNMGLIHVHFIQDFAEALKHFTSSLNIRPRYTPTAMCRAFAMITLGKVKEGIRECTKALHMDPAAPDTLLYRAMGLIKSGNVKQALRDMLLAIEMRSQGYISAVSTYLTARVCMLAGNVDRGLALLIEQLQTVGFMAFEALDLCERIVQAHMQLNQPLEAVKLMSDAIAARPKFSRFYLLRGRANAAGKVIAEAIEDFTKAVRFDRNDAAPLVERGFCKLLARTGDCGTSDFEAARKLQKRSPLPVTYLGAACFMMGDAESALKHMDRAVTLQPACADHWVNRSVVYAQMGRYNEAIGDCNTAIENDRSCAVAFFNRAVLYEQLGDIDMALHDYTSALQLQSSKQALWNRALLLLRKHNFEQAVTDTEVLSSEEQTVHVFKALASFYSLTARYQEATTAYTQVLKHDSQSASSYACRAAALACLRTTASLKAAARDLAKAIHLAPSEPIYFLQMGSVMQILGRYVEAKNFLSLSAKLHRSAQPLLALALTNIATGRFHDAMINVTSALDVAESKAESLCMRGVIHHLSGNYDLAKADYLAVLESRPLYDAYFNLAVLHCDCGEWAKGREAFEKAVALQPDNMGAAIGVACARAATGDLEGAVSDLTTLIRQNSFHYAPFLSRAALYVRLGKTAEAAADFSRVLALHPSDHLAAQTRVMRGQLFASLQQHALALTEYRMALQIDPSLDI